MISYDKMTLKVQEALQQAQRLAAEHGNPQIEPEHLLSVLLDDGEGLARTMLKKLGANPDLVRDQVRQGAQVLVNMTNDAWYEGTPGPYQHFLLERVRAVETDRFLVRSANRGICGVVNPRGVLVATTTGGPASFWGQIAARDTRTPWTRAGNLWLLLPLACVLAGAIPKGLAQPDRS